MHNFSTDQGKRHKRYILIGVISAVFYLEASRRFGTLQGLSLGLLSTLLYIGFARYLWKWKKLHELNIVQIPNLNGTWEGYLYTSENEENIPDEEIITEGKQKEDKVKIKTKITIEQTWDSILITLGGAESSSYSRSATILVEKKAWPTLTYNYFNEGGNSGNNVKPHYGSAMLEYDPSEDKLEGRYFNRPDHRGTHGIMELQRTEE